MDDGEAGNFARWVLEGYLMLGALIAISVVAGVGTWYLLKGLTCG